MKKGRAKEMTRPEPTIYGNCDSWDSIVGKKGDRLGAFTAEMRALRVHNEKISTAYQQKILINQNPRTVRTLRPAPAHEKAAEVQPTARHQYTQAPLISVTILSKSICALDGEQCLLSKRSLPRHPLRPGQGGQFGEEVSWISAPVEPTRTAPARHAGSAC